MTGPTKINERKSVKLFGIVKIFKYLKKNGVYFTSRQVWHKVSTKNEQNIKDNVKRVKK